MPALADPLQTKKPPYFPSGEAVDKKSFGLRIRELRIAAGLSQKGLADAADLSQSRISEWESGLRAPSIMDAPIIAAALGVPVESLFTDPTSTPPEPRRGRPPHRATPEPPPATHTPARKRKRDGRDS